MASIGFPEFLEFLEGVYQFLFFVVGGGGRGWGTKEQSPEIIKLDETESAHAITDSRKAPDKSHPNLLETDVGPESPRTVSPVTTSQ